MYIYIFSDNSMDWSDVVEENIAQMLSLPSLASMETQTDKLASATRMKNQQQMYPNTIDGKSKLYILGNLPKETIE